MLKARSFERLALTLFFADCSLSTCVLKVKLTETLNIRKYLIHFLSIQFLIFAIPNFVRSSLRESLSIISYWKTFVKRFFKVFLKIFRCFSQIFGYFVLSPWQLAYNTISLSVCQRFFQEIFNFFRLFPSLFFFFKNALNIVYPARRKHKISHCPARAQNICRPRLFMV